MNYNNRITTMRMGSTRKISSGLSTQLGSSIATRQMQPPAQQKQQQQQEKFVQSNNVQMQFSTLTRDRDRFQSEIDNATNENKNITNQISRLRNKQKTVIEQLRVAQEALGSVNGKRSSLQNEMDGLTKQLNFERNELESYTTQSETLQQQESQNKYQYCDTMMSLNKDLEEMLQSIENGHLQRLLSVSILQYLMSESEKEHQQKSKITTDSSSNINDEINNDLKDLGSSAEKQQPSEPNPLHNRMKESAALFQEANTKFQKEKSHITLLQVQLEEFRNFALKQNPPRFNNEAELMEVERSWANDMSTEMNDNDGQEVNQQQQQQEFPPEEIHLQLFYGAQQQQDQYNEAPTNNNTEEGNCQTNSGNQINSFEQNIVNPVMNEGNNSSDVNMEDISTKNY